MPFLRKFARMFINDLYIENTWMYMRFAQKWLEQVGMVIPQMVM